MSPPACDGRDRATQSRVRAAVPIPAGQLGVVLCAATKRRRSRAARARHLFAWECLHQESQTGIRPGPVRGTSRPLFRRSQNPKDTFTFTGSGPGPSQNQRVLNKRLNAGTSTEALDLEQQNQQGIQDRQKGSAVSRTRLDITITLQIVRRS